MAQGPPSFAFLVFLVALVVIGGGVGAGLLYEHNHPKRPAGPLTVAVGDNATVNYIGFFGSGPELGKVFDTSIKSVAFDNATYPKSLQFTPRKPSQYTPLGVHVGAKAPKGGYVIGNVTYGSVVTGFWKGLLGLAVNQSRYANVPPNEGYGPLKSSCLKTAPLVRTLPVLVTETPTQFQKDYPGIASTTGIVFADPTYGWTDTVLSSNSTAIVVDRMPTVGDTSSPYGWTMRVTDVTTSTITLTSELSSSSVGQVAGTIPSVTVCSSTSFLVWSVNPTNNTFVENYNHEVVGETLIFLVTVVTIVPP